MARKKKIKKVVKKKVVKKPKKAVKKKVVKKATKKVNKKVVKPEGKKSVGKKRGRPKGSTNKTKKVYTESKEPDNYCPPKSFIFLGYCPKCSSLVGSNDLASKFIWNCPGCLMRGRTSKLDKANKNAPTESKTKRQWLNEGKEFVVHDVVEKSDGIDISKIKPLNI